MKCVRCQSEKVWRRLIETTGWVRLITFTYRLFYVILLRTIIWRIRYAFFEKKKNSLFRDSESNIIFRYVWLMFFIDLKVDLSRRLKQIHLNDSYSFATKTETVNSMICLSIEKNRTKFISLIVMSNFQWVFQNKILWQLFFLQWKNRIWSYFVWVENIIKR